MTFSQLIRVTHESAEKIPDSVLMHRQLAHALGKAILLKATKQEAANVRDE